MTKLVTKDIKITLRTADHTRVANLEVTDDRMGSDVLQSAVDNWVLPSDTDYSLVNTTTGQVLNPSESLAGKVNDGDVLEVQPVLIAGNHG
jgi:hypothetical protein